MLYCNLQHQHYCICIISCVRTQLNVEAVYRELAALAEEKLVLDRSVLATSTSGDSPQYGDAPKQSANSIKRRYSAGKHYVIFAMYIHMLVQCCVCSARWYQACRQAFAAVVRLS
jgi:hypothetical protein